jgi:hypothetical protein
MKKLKLKTGWDWLARLVRNLLCKCGCHKWRVIDQDEGAILNGLRPAHQIQVCCGCEKVEEWGSCLYGDTLMDSWPDLSEWAAAEGHSPQLAIYLRMYLNVPNNQITNPSPQKP